MNHQKGFANIIIISIIAVIVIIGGYFVLTNKPKPQPPEPPITTTSDISSKSELQILFPKNADSLEIGDTYDLRWENNSDQKPTVVALHIFSQNGQDDLGYKNIATTSVPSSGKLTWKVPLLDTSYRYKLVIFGGSRKVLGESIGYFVLTDIKPNPDDIMVNSKYIFEFGNPFTITGVPLPNSNFAPIYADANTLQKSIVQIRARQFWSNACDRSPGMTDCPFQGEQLVRLETSVAGSGTKEIYLTDKSKKIEQYGGYEIKVLSINSANKQVTIVIRKVGNSTPSVQSLPPVR